MTPTPLMIEELATPNCTAIYAPDEMPDIEVWSSLTLYAPSAVALACADTNAKGSKHRLAPKRRSFLDQDAAAPGFMDFLEKWELACMVSSPGQLIYAGLFPAF